jgi:long-subunit fatty acid transport protein
MLSKIAPSVRARTLQTTAIVSLVLTAAAQPATAQPLMCDDTVLPIPAGCERPNAGLVLTQEPGSNAEITTAATGLGPAGFSISLNDALIAGDPIPVFTDQYNADRALARVQVDVKFDGLDNRRMLNVSTADLGTAYRAGETVTFRASTNYPAYLARSEVQIRDRSRAGNPVIATVPIAPNGRADWVMPTDGSGEYAYVLKVYDAAGRSDETQALGLVRTARMADAPYTPFVSAGEAEDRTAARRIPVRGGTITASGVGTPGSTIRVMNEDIPVDASGRFVVSRVLPAGDHVVEVETRGQTIRRDVNIPRSEWFYVGIADVTAGITTGGINDTESDYVNGRLAYYVKGTTESGYTITSSADTQDGPIRDMFRRLDDKDPRRVLDRLRADGGDLYPTYGDDSQSFDDTPTSGNIYLRVESDTSRLTLGNFTAGFTGPGLLNTTRELYGIEGRYQSPSVTENGDPRIAATVYAAQLDTIAQRDILRGTGGSVYFLTHQDVSGGTTNLTVQIIDPVTGFVVDVQYLVEGVDYSVDHIQGVILLNAPLGSSASDDDLLNTGIGDYDVNLIAQYEYTPTSALSDANAFGGRVEGWVNDEVRIGATVMTETTGVGEDQEMAGADVRYQHSEGTYVELEYATTSGPGLTQSTSTDGGLTITSTGGVVADQAGAAQLRARVDLQDIGLGRDGYVGLYYDQKDEGFSTLNETITADQSLIGLEGEIAASARVDLAFGVEQFEQDGGTERTKVDVVVGYQINDHWSVDAGLSLLDQVTPGDASETGERTDLILRATYDHSDDLSIYVFGQTTLEHTGGLDTNARYGVGVDSQLTDKLAASAEISDGDAGTAGAVRLSYAASADNQVYIGYTLDPTRSGAGSTLRDNGTIVAGGRYQHSSSVSTYTESTFDMPGNQRSLTQTYGVTYTPDETWTIAGSMESGRVRDSVSGDFDRSAFSLGTAYAPNEDLSMRARLEYGTEDGVGTDQDRETYGLSLGYANQVHEDWRMLMDIEALYSDAADGAFHDGEYARASLGYAYRPLDNEKLNLLLRYTWLNDQPGEDQISANGNDEGLLQRSHVFALAASYDLNPAFTLGGKLAYRKSQVADRGTTDFTDNTATLAALRLDWHVVSKWDVMGEGRVLFTDETETTETGALIAAYRHMGDHVKLGLGYEWGNVSDDAFDIAYNSQGLFLNIVGKF